MGRLFNLRRSHSESAFTAVEALIAVGLTMMFVAVAYSSLSVSMRSQEVLALKHDAVMTEIFLLDYMSRLPGEEQVEEIEVISPACEGEAVVPAGLVLPHTPNCVIVSGHRGGWVVSVVGESGQQFILNSVPLGFEPSTVDAEPSFIPPTGVTAEEFWNGNGNRWGWDNGNGNGQGQGNNNGNGNGNGG